MKTFEARTRKEWREWLSRRHGSEPEVWLVFFKGKVAKEFIGYDESVEEALCYGWVDSLIRGIVDIGLTVPQV